MLARAVSATPPSIVIVAPVLGGPECVRVVLSSSSTYCTRATRRSAVVASYIAVRIEVEGAQRGAQEILLRMRTAARDRRRGVIARRTGLGGYPRAGYERQVRIRLAGVTPLRRSRIRAAASEAAANSGPIVLARAVSATPPSIVIVAPVLGGPQCVRALCWKAAAPAPTHTSNSESGHWMLLSVRVCV